MEWKLKRGKWRPKLLDYAKSAKEDDVRETSLEAFKSAAEISKDAIADAALDTKPIKDALQPLISLKVGPCMQLERLVCAADIPTNIQASLKSPAFIYIKKADSGMVMPWTGCRSSNCISHCYSLLPMGSLHVR